MKHTKVYIAHPLFGDGSDEWGDIDRNVERYLRFVGFATMQGYAVVSWVHLHFAAVRGLCEGDADFYLAIDRTLLQCADEVWVCGDPAASSGTRKEIEWAAEFGLPVRQDAHGVASS